MNCVLSQASFPCLLPCPFAPHCVANPSESISLSQAALLQAHPFWQARSRGRTGWCCLWTFRLPGNGTRSSSAILLSLGLEFLSHGHISFLFFLGHLCNVFSFVQSCEKELFVWLRVSPFLTPPTLNPLLSSSPKEERGKQATIILL